MNPGLVIYTAILLLLLQIKHIDELLEELGPLEAESDEVNDDEESWETDEEEMDQN